MTSHDSQSSSGEFGTLTSTLCNAGVDWRQKMENQRGAVLATELKNNANKLAKWTAAALISGADMIKLGYVSRVHMRDNFHHAVLGTQVGCCSPYMPAALSSWSFKDFSVELCICAVQAVEPDGDDVASYHVHLALPCVEC